MYITAIKNPAECSPAPQLAAGPIRLALNLVHKYQRTHIEENAKQTTWGVSAPKFYPPDPVCVCTIAASLSILAGGRGIDQHLHTG